MQMSGEDPQLQASQVDYMLQEGIKALVLVASDKDQAKDIIDKAHKNGVKVIAHDRMVIGGIPDLYIAFDNRTGSGMEAEYLINLMPRGRDGGVSRQRP